MDHPKQEEKLPEWTSPPKPGMVIRSRNMNNEPIFSKPRSDLRKRQIILSPVRTITPSLPNYTPRSNNQKSNKNES